jgi:anti-anti-sigma factor
MPGPPRPGPPWLGPPRPGPPRLGFTVTNDRGAITVVLGGDLDIGNRHWLAQHLAQAMGQRPRRLVVDMAEVGFADCASMRLIVHTGQSLPDGSRPVICRPRPVVRRVLHVTGLDTLCDLT